MNIKESKTTIDTNGIYGLMNGEGFKHIYLLTIAKHQVKDYVSQNDLLRVHTALKCRLADLYVPLVAYEISPKYRQLHMHGIALTKRAVFFKENCSILGFRIQWRKIYDLEKAIQYVYKDAYNSYIQEQILIMNYYSHHYGF